MGVTKVCLAEEIQFTHHPLVIVGVAIYGVESSYNPCPEDGDGGKAVGPFQIWMCVVEDVNERWGTNYTSEDRRDLLKSSEIFVRYCMRWEPKEDMEAWARLWNGGPQWREKKEKTDEYWKKVQIELNKEQ